MKLPTRQLLALGACSGLLLAACASTDADPSTQSSADPSSTTSPAAFPETGGACDATVLDEAPEAGDAAAALATVDMGDDPTSAPTVTFEAPLAIDAEAVHIATEGTGDAAASGDIVTFNFVVCDIVTGEKLHSTWGADPADDAPETYIISAASFGEVLAPALEGASAGTQLLWAQPGIPAEESSTGEAINGYLYAMTITGTKPLLDAADGAEVAVTDETLPTITIADGKPTVAVPDSFTEPTDLVVQPLLQGDGATVAEGDNVLVKYTGWLTDGTQFDSSWDREAPNNIFEFTVGAGRVIQGWEQGVEGQQVGSRLLLVIPSDLAYGDTDNGDIPAGSTLIFAVDILAVY